MIIAVAGVILGILLGMLLRITDKLKLVIALEKCNSRLFLFINI